MLNTLRKFFTILANASEPRISTPTHQAEVEDHLARRGIFIERGKPGIPTYRHDLFDHALQMSQRRRAERCRLAYKQRRARLRSGRDK